MPDQNPLDVEAIRARLDAATPGPWSRFGREIGNEDGDSWYLGHDIEGPPEAERGQFERVADAELIANAPTDLRRLLDENARLNAAYVTLSDIARGNLDQVNELRAELNRALREAAADKAAGTSVNMPEYVAHHMRTSYAKGVSDTAGEFARLMDRVPDDTNGEWGLGYDQGYNAALADVRHLATVVPGMPHPPAQGCTCFVTDEPTWTTYGDAVEPGSMYEPNPECPEHGAHTEILPAQEGRGDAETSETGSGRGTGVSKPHTRSQGSLPVEEGP